jgi:subtilisin family serine protease
MPGIKIGNKLFLLALMGALLNSCGPKNDSSQTEAISNRPQSYDRFIAIIRLSEPALLSTAKKIGPTVKTDEKLLARIEAEQKAYIEELKTQFTGIQVLSTYQLVLNGITIAAPIALRDEFKSMAQVSFVEAAGQFDRAITETIPLGDGTIPLGIEDNNSATFIGSSKVTSTLKVPGPNGTPVPVDGKGLRVGVIDTGVDYTHKALGGSGSVSEYQSNDRNVLESGSFPTQKVVGGYDFVGATYNPGSPDFEDHIPKPDGDPLDSQGHGTHVSATVAGMGDGQNTYDGVAPEASIYAIKVFSDGKYGSTSDNIVISALEYAVDPDGDNNPSDRLDLINLSLGSSFGTRHILYEEALKNLVVGGDVVAIASAGNSGNHEYIVGAPSTVPEAISIAASVDDTIEEGRYTDILAPFSSRGPRSLDGLFKPEVTAPGWQILSAKVGGGTKGTRMSGTSMAAPHVAGMAALVKQANPTYSAAELKSLIVNSTVNIKDGTGKSYPLAQQGSGRVRAYEAATAPVLFDPPTITLGMVNLTSSKTITKTIRLTNKSNKSVQYNIRTMTSTGLTIKTDTSVDLAPGKSKTLKVDYRINPNLIEDVVTLDGVLRFVKPGESRAAARVPAMAVVKKPSRIGPTGSAGQMSFINQGSQGEVWAFKKIAEDAKEVAPSNNPDRTVACDMRSAGYRVITKGIRKFLQFGINLHSPLTSWHLCEVSVQIARTYEDEPEQELLGTYIGTLTDKEDNGEGKFGTYLMDWGDMEKARAKLEANYDLNKRSEQDYLAAAKITDDAFMGYAQSSVAIMQVELSKVAKADDGTFYVKIGVLSGGGTEPAADDFLGEETEWHQLDPASAEAVNSKTTLSLDAGETGTIAAPFSEDMVIYLPRNKAGSTQL